MATTPIFAWRYQALSDPPNGAALGENGFLDAEATVAALSATVTAADSSLDTRVDALEAAVYRAVQTLAAPATTVTFTGIPSTLRRLTLSWTARSSVAAVAANLRMRVNNDSSSVYSSNFTQQNNVTNTPLINPAVAFWQVGVVAGASAAANNFGSGEVIIPGWNGLHPNLNQQHRNHFYESTVSSWYQAGGGLYFAAGPYTRLDIFCDTGDLVANSEFLVTGIV